MTTRECLICGSSMRSWLQVPGDALHPSIKQGYALEWCSACESGQVEPRPDAAEVPGFYDVEDYYTHGETLEKPSRNLPFLDRLRIHLAWRLDHGQGRTAEYLSEILGDEPRRCLDIGCGDGSMLSLIAEWGHEVTGIDPDPAARSVAAGRHIKVHEGTAEAIPETLNGETFDFVFMTHSLEHCLSPLEALENAHRLTNDGGTLVLETPNNAATGLKQAGPAWPWLDVPRHLNFFTPRSLRLVAERAGFTVRSTEFYGYCGQFEPGWLDSERRIRRAFATLDPNGNWGNVPALRSRAWRLLMRTVLASPSHKYHSVRVTCSRN